MTTHRGRVPEVFNFSGDQVSDGLSNIAGIASWTRYLINHPTRQIPREICFQSGKTGSEFAGREYCRNTTVLQPFRENIRHFSSILEPDNWFFDTFGLY